MKGFFKPCNLLFPICIKDFERYIYVIICKGIINIVLVNWKIEFKNYVHKVFKNEMHIWSYWYVLALKQIGMY